jgi:purine catabolism regulator
MALAGADVNQVTDALSSSLHQRVIVLDPTLEILAFAGFEDGAEPAGGTGGGYGPSAAGGFVGGAARPVSSGPLRWKLDDPRLREAFDTATAKRLPLRLPSLPGTPLSGECVLAPICVGEQVLGFILVTTDRRANDEDLDLLNVQHAASIYALALIQAQRDAELRARYKRELLEGLLAGHLSRVKAAELAVIAGLIADAPYWIVAIAPAAGADGEADVSLLASVARALDGRAPGTVAVPRSGHVAVFLPCLELPGATGPSGLASFGFELAGFLGQRFSGHAFAIGASSRVPDPSGLGAADEQARRALDVARRMGVAGEVTTYDDLGIHRLLLHVDHEDLREFSDDVLGGLAAYDKARHSCLVETLATYLNTNQSLRQTAKEMVLHVNTVSYRIKRIEAITGLSLADPSQRLVAQVAIEIRRVLDA